MRMFNINEASLEELVQQRKVHEEAKDFFMNLGNSLTPEKQDQIMDLMGELSPHYLELHTQVAMLLLHHQFMSTICDRMLTAATAAVPTDAEKAEIEAEPEPKPKRKRAPKKTTKPTLQ